MKVADTFKVSSGRNHCVKSVHGCLSAVPLSGDWLHWPGMPPKTWLVAVAGGKVGGGGVYL